MTEDKALYELIDEYYRTRPNLQRPNPKVAILFAAVSGAGKTTIRQELVNRLEATYISNDEVRALLRQHNLTDIPVGSVAIPVWRRITEQSPNHLFIYDSSISYYYKNNDGYYNAIQRAGYKIYLIAIDLPKQELIRRVRRRARYDSQEIIDNLPWQLEKQRQALIDLSPNYTVGPNANYADLVRVLCRSIGRREDCSHSLNPLALSAAVAADSATIKTK